MASTTYSYSNQITFLIAELRQHKVSSQDSYQYQHDRMTHSLQKLYADCRAYFIITLASLAIAIVLIYLTGGSVFLAVCTPLLLLSACGFDLSSRITRAKQRITEFEARFRQISETEMYELANRIKTTGDDELSQAVVNLFAQNSLLRVNERDAILPILCLYDEYRGGETFRQMFSDHMVTQPDIAHS
jgi:hypothetical protein